jgi:hypothetical protein
MGCPQLQSMITWKGTWAGHVVGVEPKQAPTLYSERTPVTRGLGFRSITYPNPLYPKP